MTPTIVGAATPCKVRPGNAGAPRQAALPYQGNPVAVHLRAMNMLYEGLKEKGSMIIVPSTAVETMNLGAMGGLAALSDRALPPPAPPAQE